MDVHDHLMLQAELSLNDTGQCLISYEISYIHSPPLSLCLSYYAGQHISRAISLLPEYFWFVEVSFVS